jgi:hypothetical protein
MRAQHVMLGLTLAAALAVPALAPPAQAQDGI